ncbi:hypothetical protein DFJ77DRAFT_453770 [Powellomyces hirtus]|nr:hypothetical protein DFJ77DRAFT_453770 [Powellomyces hirtus]
MHMHSSSHQATLANEQVQHGKYATPPHHPVPGGQITRAPTRPLLAFIISFFATILFGPFSFLLACFYTTPRTRFGMFLAQTVVYLVQGIILIIAGVVISKNCRDEAARTPSGQPCESSYGYYHRTDNTFEYDCATTCSTIMKVLGYTSVPFFVCCIGAAIGATISRRQLRRQRAHLQQI